MNIRQWMRYRQIVIEGEKYMRRADREVKNREEIINILNSCKTASIAMIDRNMPYVVPMSYGYEFVDDSLVLYFHCATEGKKLDILKENNRVCFDIFCEGTPVHAEIPCNFGYYFSSIIGNGTAEIIDNSTEKCYSLEKIFAHQAGRKVEITEKQAATVCVFKVVSAEYSCKQKK